MKINNILAWVLGIWLLSILSVFFLGFTIFPHSSSFSGDFLKAFANWDGNYFLSITLGGYKRANFFAFLPLYPLTVKVAGFFIRDAVLAGMFISMVSSLSGLLLFYKLCNQYLAKEEALKSLIFILVFPVSFYFLTVYSEGLFFFLAISAFYFLRKKRIFLACLMASLSAITRLSGLAVCLAVGFGVLTHKDLRKDYIFLLILPLMFGLYCYSLFIKTGNPFYFLISEQNWQRFVALPGRAVVETIYNLTLPGVFAGNFVAFLNLLTVIFGLGLSLRAFRVLPGELAVYAVASVLIPLSTSNISSMPRFILPVFPIFMVLSKIENPVIIFVYSAVSLPLLVLASVLFINGYWVS